MIERVLIEQPPRLAPQAGLAVRPWLPFGLGDELQLTEAFERLVDAFLQVPLQRRQVKTLSFATPATLFDDFTYWSDAKIADTAQLEKDSKKKDSKGEGDDDDDDKK